MTSAVVVKNLFLEYRHEQVLRDLSFTISAGEFFIIIGPNGAGKTSLLKIFSRMVLPTSGSVDVMGKPLADYKRKSLSRKVAVVPQSEAFDFPFTVAETVLMGRSPHLSLLALERTEDLEIAHQAMEFTGTAHLAHRRLDQLSGGERQRVIIARAICQQPEIILLDEPTTALDPAHQLKVMDLMERFRREFGTTIIMVSHDLNLAAMYADRLLLLKEGKIQQEGKPEEVLTEKELYQGYGCKVMIDKSPAGDSVRVNLVPEKWYDYKG